MHDILSAIGGMIMNTISGLGYPGVILLMAVESANIPLPSEVIMPFAGFLVYKGELSLIWVAVAGGLGCTLGSAMSWWIGMVGGRPLVERYGRYLLLDKDELDRGEKWFIKYGHSIAFFSRLLPVVRTFISFPAGISRVPIGKFLLYTFLGSVIWSYLLALVGYKMGENWENIEVYWRKFDYLIVGAILALFVWWIIRKVKKMK